MGKSFVKTEKGKKKYTVLGRLIEDLTVYQRLIVIVFLGFLLRVAILIFSIPGMTRFMGDTKAYVWRSKNILDGKVPYRDFKDTKPPLWSYSLALWFKLLGKEPTVTGVKAFILIFSMLNILLIYLIAQRLFSEKEALITALFFALNPLDIFNSMSFGRYDAVPLFFALLSFYYLQKMRWKLSALFLGIAIMFKYIVGLLLFPYIIYLFYQEKVEEEKKGIELRSLTAFMKEEKVWKYVFIVFSFCFIIALPFLLIDWYDYLYYTLDFAHGPRPGISIYGVISHALIYYHPEMDWIRGLGPIEILLEFSLLVFVTKKVLKGQKNLENTKFVFLAFLWSVLLISLSMTVGPQYFEYSMPWLGMLFAKYLYSSNKSLRLIISTMLIPPAVVLSYLLYSNHFEISSKGLYYVWYGLGVIFLDLLVFYALIKYYAVFIKKTA